MLKIWKAGPTKVFLGLGLAAIAPAWAAVSAHPGSINYVEGQVDLNGQQLSSKAVGSSEVETGQVLETGQGKVEMLLTPGVFLRLGNGSAVRMDSPGLTDTRVALLRGEAMVEVTQLYKENNVQIADNGATATLLKRGVYEFDPNRIAVFDGEVQIKEGDSQVTLKKGKDLPLAPTPKLKAAKFDTNAHDDLYAWSNVRSEYLSEAAVQSARTYVVNGYGWYGGGWYWNPWFGMYSFLPGDGFLYSPFGWGFYSPGYIGYAPVYSGLYGRGVYGRGVYTPGVYGRGVYRPGVVVGARSAPALGTARAFSAPAARSFAAGGGFRGGFGGGARR